jgi:hypothetical protein
LGATQPLWDELVAHLEATYAPVTSEWKPGAYQPARLPSLDPEKTHDPLSPAAGRPFFLTAFVFGEKATSAVRTSDVPAAVITELNAARVYAEGRGIRLETRTPQDVATMKKLAAIKMATEPEPFCACRV